MFDKRNSHTRLIGILFVFTFIGCSNSSPIQTPKMIGAKERTGILSGKQAAVVVNKLHGRVVAADANVIAEYGREKKELLYITRYKDQKEAAESLDLMVSKIAAADIVIRQHTVIICGQPSAVSFLLIPLNHILFALH
jgi:hypothetical protein